MRVLMDLDGVLADFVGGACAAHGVKNPYSRPRRVGNYDTCALLGMDHEKFWGPLRSEDFWASLGPTDDGHEILRAAEATAGRPNICLVSMPCDWPGSAAGKIRWIVDHLPDYAGAYLLGPRKEFCASPDSVLIDDCDANVERFQEAGGYGILVPRPWNSGHAETAAAAACVRLALDELSAQLAVYEEFDDDWDEEWEEEEED